MKTSDSEDWRTGIVIVVGGALLGAVGIWAFGTVRPQLEDWVRQDPIPRLRLTLAVLGVLAVGPLFAMSAYVWRAGGRIARYRRLARGLAGLLIAIGVLMATLLWRLGTSLELGTR